MATQCHLEQKDGYIYTLLLYDLYTKTTHSTRFPLCVPGGRVPRVLVPSALPLARASAAPVDGGHGGGRPGEGGQARVSSGGGGGDAARALRGRQLGVAGEVPAMEVGVQQADGAVLVVHDEARRRRALDALDDAAVVPSGRVVVHVQLVVQCDARARGTGGGRLHPAGGGRGGGGGGGAVRAKAAFEGQASARREGGLICAFRRGTQRGNVALDTWSTCLPQGAGSEDGAVLFALQSLFICWPWDTRRRLVCLRHA
ncbi:unnamed protein product [Chondrus crispus]|uniref:Uncharacterized protein n=1 Tax=Chondrus crispus TaxID=2769 RepID=R7Q2B2_CHOCR|nr:unnamed protein product [Chondrus crispus]CDF32194.1 unnamed protein product [Chondrus crispus]|eukprot:XP_005711859.1 unnamed protein product [Chondrus crispus]